jgi:hypothetical protein
MPNKATVNGLIARLIHAGATKAQADALIARIIHAGTTKAQADMLIARIIHAGTTRAQVDGLIVRIIHDGTSPVPPIKFRDRLNRTTADGPGIAEVRVASGQPSTFRDALKNLDRLSNGQTEDVPFSLSSRIGNYDS